MIFKNERDLQRELEIVEPSNWGKHEVFYLKREVPIGECIPDLICVGYQEFPISAKWPKKWKSKYSFILSLLRENGPLSLDEIADLCFEDEMKISPLLSELVKDRTIVLTREDKYTLSYEVALIEAEVIAIEAKLTKWREALNQGMRYKQFADKVIVAMDADGAPRSPDALELFSDSNIGLCAVTHDDVEWLVEPTKTPPSDMYDNEYIINSTLVPSRQILWTRR